MRDDPIHERLLKSLTELSHTSQRRVRRCSDAISTTECRLDGQRCVSFATNDYLGLSRHPAVLQAMSEVARKQAGAGASGLIAGRSSLHAELERALAKFEGTESAVLFPSGYAANFGTLRALVRTGDAVFCDRENHASLIDGCRTSGGQFFVYDRKETDKLRQSVRRRRSEYDSVFIVTDSVFSMDGTVANLPVLCEIAEEYSATMIVDEAHGTGVFGKMGRGVCELQGVEDRVAVRIGTLSKSLGILGGFVAGSEVLCEWLWNSARSQFFSTALPPSACAAATAAVEVILAEPERRYLLENNARHFRQLLNEAGIPMIFSDGSPPGSPIIAVPTGNDERAVAISRLMLDSGFFVPAVRPPTVAKGTARLRISVCCDHSDEQIRAAVCQLRDVLQSER